jgi:hypothetical protein
MVFLSEFLNLLRNVNSTIGVRMCGVSLYRVCKFELLNVVLLIFVLNLINLHGGLNPLLNSFKFASVSQRLLFFFARLNVVTVLFLILRY